MTPYQDIDRDSGISHFEIGAGYMDVRFKSGGTYRYSQADIGQNHLRNMIALAERRDGLHSYINKNKLVRGSGKKVR